MLKSLRARVTVLATVVLIVVLGLASLLIVSLVRRQVTSDLAEQNERTLTEYASRIESGQDPSLIQLPLGSDGTEYVIFDERGNVVQASIVFAEMGGVEVFEELPDDFFIDESFNAELIVQDDFMDFIEFEESAIVASAPDGASYQVVGYTPMRIVERSVDQVSSVLWVVIPLVAALFAALTWVLTNRMLKPVSEMTDRANQIRSETLHQRLVEPGTGDEIDQLAVTLNSMLDRLDVSARLQEQFVSDASHELKSPLTVMIGEAELAQNSQDHKKLSEANDRIVRQGRKLAGLVDDLLALARSGELAMRYGDVDLDNIIQEQIAAQSYPIDASGVHPVRAVGDVGALSRLIRNLVENAVRHATSSVQVLCQLHDGYAVVHVDDDGAGVPVEERDRIFERFSRLDEARTAGTGGSGLGLAISKAIVESHRGTLTVKDSPGGGARFTVKIPVPVR